VEALGLNEFVIFTGVRNDVPELMTSLLDCFVFPSVYEGFGIAVLEAQAAGLQCIISDSIPHEVDVIPDLVTRVSLDDPVDLWAKTILDRTRQASTSDRRSALQVIEESDYNIARSASILTRLYKQELRRAISHDQ
jgi:glycosyltransferase involved in cell wall biosynthesis